MNIAIIAAAGQGKRMGDRRAKQFLELAGTPIIIHTLKRFDECADIHETVVVLPPSDLAGFPALTKSYGLRKPLHVVVGGTTRADSVWRGLKSLTPENVDIVAVHDSVRPFVSPDDISRTIRAASEFGAAVLVAPATDTIKEIQNGRVSRTLDRNNLRHALTPQCFRYDLLRRAYEHAPDQGKDATDCSALVERLGEVVVIVEGDPRNIKITRPEDIALAEILVRQNAEGGRQNTEARIQKNNI
jgi:2-C-methyl-D-erythritol 4-phosphate cytidylyltransferase